MKRITKMLATLAVTTLLIPSQALAYYYDFEVNGIYYIITSIENSEVGVTCYGDPYEDRYDYYKHTYWGNVVIPETVTYKNQEFSVTSILGVAFWGCAKLTSIDIPNSVTSIGVEAFYKCSGLTSINIPDGVTSIEKSAFEGCTGLTSVKISNTVTYINHDAFANCDTIEEFVFPSGTQSYPQYSEDGKFGLFGFIRSDEYHYNGTVVKNLRISASPNTLYLEPLDTYFNYNSNNYCYNYEPYYLMLKELYIGRKLDMQLRSNNCDLNVFSTTLEKAEIGGCLKSDIIVTNTTYNKEFSINDLGPTNIKTIIYGDSIAEITAPCTSASEIYLRSTTPPVTKEWENSNYINSILYVPQGTLAVYQNAYVWKNFWDIREWDATTDVKSPTIDNADAVDVSIDGKQVTVSNNNPGTRVQIYNTEGVLVYDGKEGTVNIETPGLYIIKAGNQTKKLLVK